MKTVLLACLMGLCVSGSTEASLTLEARAARTTMHVGEPLVVDIAIINQGARDVRVPIDLSPAYGSAFELRLGEGPFEAITAYPTFDANSPTTVLGPGEFLTYTSLIGNHPRDRRPRAIFPEPGVYTFRARFGGAHLDPENTYGLWDTAEIATNDVVVTIVAPRTPRARAAAELMLDPNVVPMMHYHMGAPRNDEQREIVQAILESDSEYSPYAAYALAWARPLPDLAGTEVIEQIEVHRKWADDALAYLDMADVEGFPLRAEVVRAKIEAQRSKAELTRRRGLRNSQRGLDTIAEMQHRFPDLYTADVEAERLEERLLRDFPNSAAASQVRKDIEARRNHPRRP